MNKKTSRQIGFTLTELMLAMAFLSFVLIFIVVAMLQYIGNYNKGLTYKEINQAGRTIFEDLTREMRTNSANVRVMDKGRLCVGGQTYVWNTPDTSPQNKYDDDSVNAGEPITGIIRVTDSTGTLCIVGGGSIPNIPQEDETIIARSNVAVQSFSAQSGDQGKLYSLKLDLSTSDDNAPVASNGQCSPGRDGQFCATASFETNIATRK